MFFFFSLRELRWGLSLTTCALRACPFGIRANNLQPKLKQLSVVLTTVDTTKQGVGRAECIEAIGEDYATCAVGREAQSHPIPFEFPTFQHWHIEIWKAQRLPNKKIPPFTTLRMENGGFLHCVQRFCK